MWLALKITVCFLRRVGNHSRRAAKDAASRNEFAYRLAPSFYVEMDAISVKQSGAVSAHPAMLPRKHLSGLATLQQGTHDCSTAKCVNSAKCVNAAKCVK